jgi:hypothetical protein
MTLGVEQKPHPARWKDLKAPGAVVKYDRRNYPYGGVPRDQARR